MSTPKTTNANGERLQKVLARAGLASRRAAEELITKGRVRVDGRVVTELGVRVGPKAKVEVDGKKIEAEPFVYLILHKPRAVMCTLSDPEGRPTVAELVRGAGARVVPVGRLDFHTSGALLMSNDGDFAGVITHPRHKVPKIYVAKVRGLVDDRALERLRQSIEIDGQPTRPAEVTILRFEGDKTWLRVVLQEGKNRQVRRLGEFAGFPVMRLARLEHAGISTEGLRPGTWRHLSVDELNDLKHSYGVPRRVHAPPVLEPQRGRPRPSPRPRPSSGARPNTGARPSSGARPSPGPGAKESPRTPARRATARAARGSSPRRGT
jgi:23S rRNA pseudouridine2605 synthase